MAKSVANIYLSAHVSLLYAKRGIMMTSIPMKHFSPVPKWTSPFEYGRTIGKQIFEDILSLKGVAAVNPKVHFPNCVTNGERMNLKVT